jgi:hypothetical protein
MRDERDKVRRWSEHAHLSEPHGQQLGDGGTLIQLLSKGVVYMACSSKLNSGSREESSSARTSGRSEGVEQVLALDGVGVVDRGCPSRASGSNTMSSKDLRRVSLTYCIDLSITAIVSRKGDCVQVN